MSELKTYKMVDEEYCTDCVCVIPSEVYLKSEADKVIAELKADYKEACDRLQTANLIKDEQLAAARHHKHKRCLAMADLNWWQANRYSAAEMVERIRWNLDEARQCSKLEEKYLKRYHKWLKLAEKFKEEN